MRREGLVFEVVVVLDSGHALAVPNLHAKTFKSGYVINYQRNLFHYIYFMVFDNLVQCTRFAYLISVV